MNDRPAQKSVFDKFKKPWALFLAGSVVLGAILVYLDALDLMEPWIEAILNQPVVILLGEALIVLAVAAIVASNWIKKSTLHIRLGFAAVLVLGIVAVMQPADVPLEYVVVYDSGVEPFHPALLTEVESQYVHDLEKLNMTGALENKILISTVETPLLPKKVAFPKPLAIRRPIVSLQQAIGMHQAAIVDVSLSSFETDILRVLRYRKEKPSIVNVYAEDGFSQEEAMLRNALHDEGWTVRSTIYDPRGNVTADGKSVAIFLGSSDGLANFLEKTKLSWKLLIVPNWVRPSLARIAEGTGHTNKGKSTRICAASTVFDKFMVGDPATWATLLQVVDSCANDASTDFHTKVKLGILQAFNRESETISIPF